MWPNIDETNICQYKKPFGEMARDVYSDFCWHMSQITVWTALNTHVLSVFH
jgi:hypothetical protein